MSKLKVNDLTDIMLGEIAPSMDEIIAYVFSEIDEAEGYTLEEKARAKKHVLRNIAAGIVGGGAIAAGLKYRKPLTEGYNIARMGHTIGKGQRSAVKIGGLAGKAGRAVHDYGAKGKEHLDALLQKFCKK